MSINNSKPDVTHVSILQELINHYGFKTYCEIGVKEGVCFLNLNIPIKIGVEPEILYIFAQNMLVANMLYKLKGITEPVIKVFPGTSDKFFEGNKNMFDLIFVDGLHTHAQAYRDIENSIKFLNKGGIIAVHDTVPVDEKVANPTAPIVSDWSGDVYKSIIEFRTKYANWKVTTIDVPFGFTIIKETETPQELIDKKWIDIDFKTFDENKTFLVNLTKPNENIIL